MVECSRVMVECSRVMVECSRVMVQCSRVKYSYGYCSGGGGDFAGLDTFGDTERLQTKSMYGWLADQRSTLLDLPSALQAS